MHYWQRYLCFTMTCVKPYLCLDTFLLLIFPNITLLSMVYSTVARYTTVIVNRGVWVNTLGFYHTCGYGVVTGAVCEKNPRCDPCYTLDLRHRCVSHPRYFSFIMGWQRRNRAWDAFVSRALGIFFLLSFLLLLINDLRLNYLYGNHDDHDDEWPPSSQHKRGARTWYVLFFQKFTSFFSTKCLFTTDLPWWQWTATTITISRMNAGSRCRCSWFWYVNLFFTPLNNYLQSDYMYGMATRMTTVNDHPVEDDEWGTWDADDASWVPSMFFFL